MKALAAALPKAQPQTKSPPLSMDIGTYDGGFEEGGEHQDVVISAEAAEVLCLDSSTSR